MPDSRSPKTERRVQPLFRKISVFSYLPLAVMALTVLAFDQWLQTVEVRSDGPAREASVRFLPVPLAASAVAPLKLVGAWEVQVDDPRFGGVSALAMDGDALVAVTDSGSVIRLPQPGRGSKALVMDLPAGPGLPQLKINRDSEALLRDPGGRGWWVAFEHWHELWLYDSEFRRALDRVSLGADRWPANRGMEAVAARGSHLLLFPQAAADEWLEVNGRRVTRHALTSRFGDFADAVRLADGRLLIVTRKFGLTGLDKHLVVANETGAGISLSAIARLGLGRRDNVEGLAAQPLAGGKTRLWLITDNDFRPRKATLLLAVDLP